MGAAGAGSLNGRTHHDCDRHRLSTVVDADQLLFVEQGEITGRGTHHELMASHSLYRDFAEQQLKLNADLENKAV